ncbi:MAG: archaeosine biosynthesis radical SAM protein RaSEA [Methanosarcinales archaeon]
MNLNKIISDIHSHQKIKKYPKLNKPTASWIGKDLDIKTLTIIFRTSGCYWNRCTMCGYYKDSAQKVSGESLIAQFKSAMDLMNDKEEFMVKIFTSGSFLDTREIPIKTRDEILNALGTDSRVKKVIVETRPEFVTEEIIDKCTSLISNFEIAIGLETSNDLIRRDCINKGFTFQDFVRASLIAKKYNCTVKVYLLLKPPFLSEGTAISDIVQTVHDTAHLANTISINLCNVQSGTLVEEMWKKGDYRPPWLWSAVDVLKKSKKDTDIILISDPVGAGSLRGPHNCGLCDKKVAKAIKEFSLSQNKKLFYDLYCDCYELWKKVVELEDFTYGAPLKR